MLLLDPNRHRGYPDERSRAIMRPTIEFFELQGKCRLEDDDRAAVRYPDFPKFVAREMVFAAMHSGGPSCGWWA